ncbi:hypothetical protein PG985_012004 [Apiospora marii]|uniref:uncharacterized protein n=1 Tax=Apiospora marii TaxID=335849 RepID=UPI0031312F5D
MPKPDHYASGGGSGSSRSKEGAADAGVARPSLDAGGDAARKVEFGLVVVALRLGLVSLLVGGGGVVAGAGAGACSSSSTPAAGDQFQLLIHGQLTCAATYPHQVEGNSDWLS